MSSAELSEEDLKRIAKMKATLAEKEKKKLEAAGGAPAPVSAQPQPSSSSSSSLSSSRRPPSAIERVDSAGSCGTPTAHSAASSYHIVDPQALTLGDPIAQGGFSCVYKGSYRGCPVAIKKPLDLQFGRDPKVLADFSHEVDVTSELRHPNIVLLVGACLQPPNLFIVMECSEGGSLFSLLHQSSRAFDLRAIVRTAIGIARALQFMHSARPALIHRDVKSHNVLMDSSLTTAKLCDFGITISVADVSATAGDQGTPMYMAPEVLRGEAARMQSDVYSFGILLWEMTARQVPFDGLPVGTIRDKVLAGERPHVGLTVNGKIASLMKSCWASEPGARPTMAKVLDELLTIV